MVAGLLVLLIILWFLGYIRIEGLTIPDITLFVINGEAITLLELLIALVIMAVISSLSSPLREVGMILFVLWILATLGIIVFSGLANLLIIAIIIGVALSFLKKL